MIALRCSYTFILFLTVFTINIVNPIAESKFMKGSSLEKVQFFSHVGPESNQNIMRTGLLLKRPQAKATILVCHGYMCNKHDTAFLRMLFPKYNVMTFDMRAHGEHVGDMHYCTFGRDEAYDVIAAARYLQQRPDIGKIPLVAYGFSMGSVAAIEAQAEAKDLFAAMVLDCPYDKSENVIKRGLENYKMTICGYTFNLPGKSFLERHSFNPYVQSFLKMALKTVSNLDGTCANTCILPVNPVDSIKEVTIPTLFIHCINDEKISVDAIKNVYRNAPGYKRLWITQGRRHFDSFFFNPEEYAYRVNRFIEDVLSGDYTTKDVQKETYQPTLATGEML